MNRKTKAKKITRKAVNKTKRKTKKGLRTIRSKLTRDVRPYEQRSKQELLAQAEKTHIKGRKNMTKDELISALRKRR